MIAKAAAERALGEALRSGGDFAELFAEDTRRMAVALADDKVDRASTSRAHGAGIRVYFGLESVYVHTNDTSPEGLLAVARRAADAVGEAKRAANVRLIGSIAPNIHPILERPVDVPGERRARLLHSIYKAARDYDPAIRQVRAGLLGWESDVTIANSEGLLVSDSRGRQRGQRDTDRLCGPGRHDRL